MKFMKTVCINEDSWDNESYDYDDVTSGDYVVFALWDITDENYPKLLLCNDNCHSNIEFEIECYLKGVAYCQDIEQYYSRNILLCKDEYKPEFKTNKLIRCA